MARHARHRFVRDAQGAPDGPGESVRYGGAERISRSQRKRDSAALQAAGEKLALLPPARQDKLPLPPDLAEALAAFRTMPSREARRRQLQYIGRLMREADEAGTLQAVLDAWGRLE